MKTQVTIRTSTGSRTNDVLFSMFPDGDTYCLLEDRQAIKGNHVIISHDLYPRQNDRIFELLLLIDVIRDLGPKSISLFVPYLPYARQDKRHLPGEAISASTLSKTLQRAGVRTLYTFDCHFLKGATLATHEGLEISNMTLGPALIKYFTGQVRFDKYDVIAPDEGSTYLVKAHGGQSMHKQRGGYNKNTTVRHRDVQEIEHEHLKLQHKHVILIDDMISTGGTLLRAVQHLRSQKKEVYCLAVHGLFLNGCYERLVGQTKGIFVSDTLPHESSVPLVQMAWEDDIKPAWLTHCLELA